MLLIAAVGLLAFLVCLLHGHFTREIAELHKRCNDLMLALAKAERALHFSRCPQANVPSPPVPGRIIPHPYLSAAVSIDHIT